MKKMIIMIICVVIVMMEFHICITGMIINSSVIPGLNVYQQGKEMTKKSLLEPKHIVDLFWITFFIQKHMEISTFMFIYRIVMMAVRHMLYFFTLPSYQGLYFQGIGQNIETEEFGFVAMRHNPKMMICDPQLNDWGELQLIKQSL